VERFFPAEAATPKTVPPQILCKKHEGSQFHFSRAYNGIIYVSELGKMALMDFGKVEYSEDGQCLFPPRSKLLFSGQFKK
jgi:hypothetical protein